ncbi:MAG TPA: hypothetical protein VME66_09865 [Candidatus Acidoferrales bacterium]|nr:hypothetical protein [Candidatus Acidoferrales bacterium]
MTPREHLAKRGGPTLEQALARYPHGTYARYTLCLCRCAACRRANAAYVKQIADQRQLPWRLVKGRGHYVEHRVTGKRIACVDRESAFRERDRRNAQYKPKPPNELVSAAKARKHLRWLRAQGVGLKTAACAASISYSVIERIHSGNIRRTRRRNEAKILAVDQFAARGTAKIAGGPTWKLLDSLISAGYRKGWIALHLGSNTPALQMRNREFVRADKARAVRELYDRLAESDPRLLTRVGTELRPRDPVPTPPAPRMRRRAQRVPPLSKRDPAIKRRWDTLFRELIPS